MRKVYTFAVGGDRTLDLRIYSHTVYKYDALTNWATTADLVFGHTYTCMIFIGTHWSNPKQSNKNSLLKAIMFPFFWFSYFAAGQDGRAHVVYGARQSPTENVYDTSLSYIGVLLDACGDVFETQSKQSVFSILLKEKEKHRNCFHLLTLSFLTCVHVFFNWCYSEKYLI